jgi:hypothetical protein
MDVFVVFLQHDFEYCVNLLRKKKVEGQKHGQKGLFVTFLTSCIFCFMFPSFHSYCVMLNPLSTR